MSDILNSVNNNSQSTVLDRLVDSYRQTQQPKLDTLANKKSELEKKRAFYTSLNTKLNVLVSQIDTMKNKDSDAKFGAKKVSSTDSKIVTATADGDAVVSDFKIKVFRKASNDVLISDKMTLKDKFKENSGEQTFNITINGTSKEVKVTFDGEETNETAMKKIAAAINAVEDINVVAAFVKDSSSTGRLSLTSKNTGSENKIEFSDSPALKALGLNSGKLKEQNGTRKLQEGNNAGYKISDSSILDAEFDVNGITVTRGSNSVDDVLDGITLNLIKTQTSDEDAIDLTTEVDLTKVSDYVNQFLSSYNEIIKYINGNTSMRRSESSVSSLMYSMRETYSSDFSGGDSKSLKYLSDIGIKANSNGELMIDDSEKLQEQLELNPDKVAKLFTGENGLANKLSVAINPLKGDSGALQAKTASLTTQIDSNVKKSTELNAKIESQAAALRKQYTSYLDALYKAQNQYSSFSSSMTA